MKNPWMSLWLSAANRTAGTARGHWIAEAQRQQRAFMKEMTKSWSAGAEGARQKPAKRRDR